MSQQVVLLKLVTGEDIVTKLDDENNNVFTISEPRVISLQPTADGVSFGLSPWLCWILNENATTMSIRNEHVMVGPITSLPDEITKGYYEQISGLTL